MKKSFTECTEDAIRDRYRSEKETRAPKKTYSVMISLALWLGEWERQECADVVTVKFRKATIASDLPAQSFFLDVEYKSYDDLVRELLVKAGAQSDLINMRWKLIIRVYTGGRIKVVDITTPLHKVNTVRKAIEAARQKRPKDDHHVTLNFMHAKELEMIPGPDRDEDGNKLPVEYRKVLRTPCLFMDRVAGEVPDQTLGGSIKVESDSDEEFPPLSEVSNPRPTVQHKSASTSIHRSPTIERKLSASTHRSPAERKLGVKAEAKQAQQSPEQNVSLSDHLPSEPEEEQTVLQTIVKLEESGDEVEMPDLAAVEVVEDKPMSSHAAVEVVEDKLMSIHAAVDTDQEEVLYQAALEAVTSDIKVCRSEYNVVRNFTDYLI